MPWFKVKSLNYLPSFKGMDNLIISAIVEFGMTIDGVDQTAFAKEVDLLESANYEGNFLPLAEIDQQTASQFVENVLGVEKIEHLKLKAEIALIKTDTCFFY